MKTFGNFSYFGIPKLRYLGRVRTFTPGIGWTYSYRYAGPPSAINAALNVTSADQTAQVEESPEGEDWRLIISTADDPTGAEAPQIITKFSIPGNALQKDIREHPLVLPLGTQKVTVGGKETTVMNLIDKVLRQEEPIATDLAAIGAENSFPRKVYNSMRQRNGSMAFQISQFVFKVTYVAGSKAALDFAYANVNRLYTQAQLLKEANPTTKYANALNALYTANTPTDLTGYVWGWLKGSPTVEDAPGNRVAVSIDYQLEQWESWVYLASAVTP